MNAYVIGLRLTCDSPRKALKLTVGAWKPANTNPSDKMYVCMYVGYGCTKSEFHG